MIDKKTEKKITKKMTLEGSLGLIPNRFELALITVPRAKAIKNGAKPGINVPHGVSMVEVVFLELENGFLTVEKLRNNFSNNIHGVIESDLGDLEEELNEDLSEDMVRRIGNFYKNDNSDSE